MGESRPQFKNRQDADYRPPPRGFAACRAAIPFIPFGGNMDKIEGIFTSAGVNIPICRDRKDLADHIQWVEDHGAEYQKLFTWLKSFKNWRL